MQKVHIIDPHSHTQLRSEFRLNNFNTIILSNLRLADVSSVPLNNNPDTRYTANGGVMNLIKKLTLYSGNQQLDTISNFHKWYGFKNLISTQSEADGIKKPNTASVLSINTENINVQQNVGEIPAYGFNGKFDVPLPVLEDNNDLFFDDIRLVVEWNTAPATVYSADGRPASFTVNPPSLIYTEFLSKDYSELKKIAQSKPFVWNAIEGERLDVPATTNGTVQPIDTRLRGFDNKTVTRMVVVNDSSTANAYCCRTHSVAMNAEKLNFRVNGRLIMPYNGIDNENQKLRSLNAWGEATVYQGGQYTQETEGTLGESLLTMAGQFSYASFDIRQKINDLNIQFQRTGKTGEPATDESFLSQMDIYCFGEVLKQVKEDNKGNLMVMNL